MRRFDFRLERYLKLREQLETLQKVATAREEGVVQEKNRIVGELSEMSTRTQDDLVAPRGERFKAQRQQETYRYLIRLLDERKASETDLQQAQDSLKQAREKLVVRSRDRKTLERLKDHQFEAWRDLSEKEEVAMLDEVSEKAEVRKRSEQGSVFLTLLLMLVLVAAASFCFLVWKNWLTQGNVGFPILRAPFDSIAQDRAREQVLAFDSEQQVRRKKREREVSEAPAEPEVVETVDSEGLRRTMQRIEQREGELRRKEEELRSREIMLDRDRRDFLADMNRLTTAQVRIDERLAELKALEDRRTREMSDEKKRRIESLTKTVSSQNAKQAAALLLAVAFPDPKDPNAPPYPPGVLFEEVDLVVEILLEMKDKDRADILDRMVREDPAKTAVLVDMLDNVRTGLEPDQSFESAPSIP